MPLARYLLASKILGLLLPHVRSALLLHGCALGAKRKAAGFLGPPRTGKSTLTASLLNQNCRLLCDDLMVIRRKDGDFLVDNGPPEIRLWPGGANRPKGSSAQNVYPQTRKKRFVLDSNGSWKAAASPMRLRVIYLLERKRGGRFCIEPLQGQEALLGVIRNAYNRMVEPPGILKGQFQAVSHLVREVPVRRLSYPSGYRLLPEVHRALLKDIDST